jgi:hypothetical protein
VGLHDHNTACMYVPMYVCMYLVHIRGKGSEADFHCVARYIGDLVHPRM